MGKSLVEEIRRGLTSKQKYIPVWYRYDKDGSIYNDRCLAENEYYYFDRKEASILKQIAKELVSSMTSSSYLVDMGSGNCEKTRLFINEYLSTFEGSPLQYVPVDISEEFLQETSDALQVMYPDRLSVTLMKGEYGDAIPKINNLRGHKLLLWFGGIQNLAYEDQVGHLAAIQKSMKPNDRILLTLDLNQEEKIAKNAYLDPKGVSAPLHLNCLWRLNKDYGCKIDTTDFQLEAHFVRGKKCSAIQVKVKSLKDQSHVIDGLGITLALQKDEYINLYEGFGTSCKYTVNQVHKLVSDAGLIVKTHWTDEDHLVGVFNIGTK